MPLARQCWKAFGKHECRTRDDKRDTRPLRSAIRHACGVWLYDTNGYAHSVHVCRRCGAREVIK